MPKATNNEKVIIEDRQRKVAALYCEGKSQWDIAIKLGVHRITVTRDLSEIRDRWLAESVINFDEARSRELARIDHLEATTWEAWYRSCEPEVMEHKKTEQQLRYEKKSDEEKAAEKQSQNRRRGKPSKPKMIPTKIIDEVKRTGKVGNPAFLERISWCIEMRCKITGIIKEQVVNNSFQQFNWNEFLDPMDKTPADEIEDKIKSIGHTQPESNGTNGESK